MREIDSLGLYLCSYQAKLFEKSREETKCSSKIFIRRFMNSALAKRIDQKAILFESIDYSDAIHEVEDEYGQTNYGKEKFSSEELYWVGYIYRYWCYTEEKTSRQVYKIIKPDYLQKVYFPYHSLDPRQAIERIKESLGLEEEKEVDDISKGVEILRKIRQNSKN